MLYLNGNNLLVLYKYNSRLLLLQVKVVISKALLTGALCV